MVEALKTNNTTTKCGKTLLPPKHGKEDSHPQTVPAFFFMLPTQGPWNPGQIHYEAPSRGLVEKVRLFFKQE